MLRMLLTVPPHMRHYCRKVSVFETLLTSQKQRGESLHLEDY